MLYLTYVYDSNNGLRQLLEVDIYDSRVEKTEYFKIKTDKAVSGNARMRYGCACYGFADAEYTTHDINDILENKLLNEIVIFYSRKTRSLFESITGIKCDVSGTVLERLGNLKFKTIQNMFLYVPTKQLTILDLCDIYNIQYDTFDKPKSLASLDSIRYLGTIDRTFFKRDDITVASLFCKTLASYAFRAINFDDYPFSLVFTKQDKSVYTIEPFVDYEVVATEYNSFISKRGNRNRMFLCDVYCTVGAEKIKLMESKLIDKHVKPEMLVDKLPTDIENLIAKGEK